MRFVLIFFLLLVLLFEGALFFLFTSPGNTMLLPFVNQYLAHKVPQAKIHIEKLRLKPDHIGLVGRINDAILLKAAGDIDLFSQAFDLNYSIAAKKITTPTMTLDAPVYILGSIKGVAEKMKIHGQGTVLQAPVRYALALVKQHPENIKIDIKEADLAALLTLAGQPAYARGRLSLHANMPEFTPLTPKVDALLSIQDGDLDTARISSDLNLSLPAKVHYQTHFKIHTRQGRIAFDGSLNSSLGNLALKEGTYHLLSNSLSTNYRLTIPKLQTLSSLANMPLGGSLVLDGDLKYKDALLSAAGKSKSLGGTARFNYRTDALSIILDQINNSKLLTLLGQPHYLSGTTAATIKLSSLKQPTGTFTLQTRGNTNRAVIKKAFDLDLGKKFSLALNTKGTLKNNAVSAILRAKTTMANLQSDSIRLDLKTAALHAGYRLDIPDMRRLQPLTGKAFKGAMQITGKLSKTKQLLVTGHGKEFGGTIDFKLLDEKFHADVVGVTVSKVMAMLDYPQVLEALSKATVDYNTKSASGTLHATLDNAKILPNQLTKLLKQFQIIDLTKERFNNSKFDARISKTMIDFTLDARNKNNYFVIKNGKLNKQSGMLNAKVDMKLKGKDLQATIRGSIDHPKVSLDGSSYLQDRAKTELKKRFGKKIDKAKEKFKKNLGSKLGGALEGLF